MDYSVNKLIREVSKNKDDIKTAIELLNIELEKSNLETNRNNQSFEELIREIRRCDRDISYLSNELSAKKKEIKKCQRLYSKLEKEEKEEGFELYQLTAKLRRTIIEEIKTLQKENNLKYQKLKSTVSLRMKYRKELHIKGNRHKTLIK